MHLAGSNSVSYSKPDGAAAGLKKSLLPSFRTYKKEKLSAQAQRVSLFIFIHYRSKNEQMPTRRGVCLTDNIFAKQNSFSGQARSGSARNGSLDFLLHPVLVSSEEKDAGVRGRQPQEKTKRFYNKRQVPQ